MIKRFSHCGCRQDDESGGSLGTAMSGEQPEVNTDGEATFKDIVISVSCANGDAACEGARTITLRPAMMHSFRLMLSRITHLLRKLNCEAMDEGIGFRK